MKPHSDIAAQTIEYYNRNAAEFFRETVEVDMSEIYEPFLELLPAGGKILDAGCGSGRDSLFFSQKGFEVTAFDASAKMARMASNLTKLEVAQIRFDEITWTDKFDGIWACASLLHLPKNELASVFQLLIEALKTDGIMYASFKEGAGEITENERFFSYYKVDELKNMLEKIRSKEFINCWLSNDVRRNSQSQNWINLLIRKVS